MQLELMDIFGELARDISPAFCLLKPMGLSIFFYHIVHDGDKELSGRYRKKKKNGQPQNFLCFVDKFHGGDRPGCHNHLWDEEAASTHLFQPSSQTARGK